MSLKYVYTTDAGAIYLTTSEKATEEEIVTAKLAYENRADKIAPATCNGYQIVDGTCYYERKFLFDYWDGVVADGVEEYCLSEMEGQTVEFNGCTLIINSNGTGLVQHGSYEMELSDKKMEWMIIH